jgi:hypothetical protein
MLKAQPVLHDTAPTQPSTRGSHRPPVRRTRAPRQLDHQRPSPRRTRPNRRGPQPSQTERVHRHDQQRQRPLHELADVVPQAKAIDVVEYHPKRVTPWRSQTVIVGTVPAAARSYVPTSEATSA